MTADLPVSLFGYRASLVYVVDGDTADLRVDLGMGVSRIERVRFMGINAPERGDEPGYTDAKDYVLRLKARLDDGSTVLYIRTVKDSIDNWGRYLAWLYEVDEVEGLVTDVSQQMLVSGLVTEYTKK